MPHLPVANEENERLASLHRYAVLDTPPEAAFDRLAALAARLFDVPVALVSLVDKDRQWFKARQGTECDRLGIEIRREIAFCAHTILSQDVLVVEDARLDPRFADNPLVAGETGLRFYAGAPLVGADGLALGAFCLMDFQPRPFSAAQQESLQDLAASVVSELELRRSVAAFAESEHLYRQMFEDSPQPMWVFDVETLDFLAVNDTAVAQFGYSRAEFLRLKLSDLRHPDDLAAMLTSIQTKSRGTRFVGLCRNFKKNGDLVWTDIISHPLSFAGRTARLTVATDVTERKAAEEALQRTLSMMQAQQTSDPDGILVVDENHRIVTYNPRLREIWPLPDALCGLGDDSGLFHHLQPLLQGTDAWLTEHGPSLDSFQSEVALPDGRFLDSSSNPILSGAGHYYGRLWVFREVTKRRAMEEALQRSLSVLKAQQEAALDGILVVDENRRIVSYNQRLCDLWNTPSEIIQSGDDEKHLAYALSLLKTPEEFLQRVLHLYEHPEEYSRDEVEMRDGRTFDRYSGPIISAEGKSHGRIWSFRDVTERKQTEEALRRSEQRLSLHLQQTPLAVVEFALDMTITYWNAAAETVFGHTAAEALGQNGILLLVPDEERAYVEQVCMETTSQTSSERGRNHNRTKSGQVILCEWYTTPLVDDQGCVIGIASLARDVTEEQHALDDLARSEARKTTILETALDCIVSVDCESRILEWNPAAERTFGYCRAEVLGRNVNTLIVPFARRASVQQRMQQYLITGDGLALNRRVETTLLHRSGLEFPVEFSAAAVQADGFPIFTIYLRDITEQKRLEVEREALLTQTENLLAEALERADRDPLTGLLNHRAFHKRLKEEVGNAERTGQCLAVLMLDLNNFKFFNDIYGHLAGDDVLKQVTQALQWAGRSQDVLARFGGDEFALLMPGADHAAAMRQAEALHAAAARVTYQPPGYEVAIPFSFSLGVACFPEDGAGRTDLLDAAGDRLRVAKTGGEEEKQAFHLRRDLSQSVGGFTMLDALVTAVDNKDRYTRRHSEDVLEYSIEIAQALGLDAKTQQTVKVAALLHDVGKIGVPDAVLRKPGKLNDEEYEAIQQHPLMGAIIVGAVAGFEDTLDAVRHHHERWDGHGYPFGLHGAEIPLMARLMAVADAYSAMTTDRPYRKGMEPARALHILENGAGTQWDPECVQTFLRVRRTTRRTVYAAD